MIEIYVGSPDLLLREFPGQVQFDNDAWFENRFIAEVDLSPEMINILERVDEVEYLGHNIIASKFDSKYTLPLMLLSTGCKTVLNCMAYPDIIFPADVMGENAVVEVLKLSKARICFFGSPDRIDEDIQNDFMFKYLRTRRACRCSHYNGVFEGGDQKWQPW